ncbi:MAG: hypothetical protein ACRCXT_14045 [Paraclostridium sp.]
MLAVKEVKELEGLIKKYRADDELIRFIHLAHLIDPKKDDSVLRLKELLIMGNLSLLAENKED